MPGVNTGTALLILVVFVLPGFIAVLVKERIYEVRPEETTFDRLLVSVYYSLLIWSVPVVTALAGQADRGDLERFFVGRSPVWVMVVVAVGVLLVLPVAAALLTWAWVRSSWRSATLDLLRLPAAHGTPTSWDFAFDAEDDLFVVVTMRDGRQLAGYYGSRSPRGTGHAPETSSWRSGGNSMRRGAGSSVAQATPPGSGSTPMTSSLSTDTLLPMFKDLQAKLADRPRRRTPRGLMERGRQPVVIRGKPTGPFSVAGPPTRPKR